MAKVRCDCYSLLDKDFNIVKTMSGEEIEKKYNILIDKEINKSKDFYLNGFLVIEDDIASKEKLKKMTYEAKNQIAQNFPSINSPLSNENKLNELKEIKRLKVKNERNYKKNKEFLKSFNNTDEHFKLFEETINHYYYISTLSEAISIDKRNRKRNILKKVILNSRSYFPITKNGKCCKYYVDDLMAKYFFASINKNFKVQQIVKSPTNYSFDNLRIVRKEKWELLEGFKCFHENETAKYFIDTNGIIAKMNKANNKIKKLEGRFRNNSKTVKFDKKERKVATIVLETFKKLPYKYTYEYIDGNPQNCSLNNLLVKETKISQKRSQEFLEHEKKTLETKGYRFVTQNTQYALYVNEFGQFLRVSIKTGKQFLVKCSHSKNRKHYQLKVNGKAKYAETYIVEAYKDYFKLSDDSKYKITFKDNNPFNLRIDNIVVDLLT